MKFEILSSDVASEEFVGSILKRVSMGLTDRRKKAKNLVDSRKN